MLETTPEPSRTSKSPFVRMRSLLTGDTTKLLGREMWNSLRIIIVLLVLCGGVFPLVVFAIGQVAFNSQANGSLITDNRGRVIGSHLLGQQFTRPEYFHGRPSVVSYDASNSSGSNVGPTNSQLINGNGSEVTVAQGTPAPTGGTPVAGKKNTYYVPGTYLGVQTYADQFRRENGLAPNTPLPADIVTASGSGLDPDISVEAATLQVNRIVAARHALGGKNATITTDQVKALIANSTHGRDVGIMGEPRVTVLELNIALDKAYAPPA